MAIGIRMPVNGRLCRFFVPLLLDPHLGAGVDMLMVMALQSREEMRRVVDAFPGADVINVSSIRPALSDAEYVEMG